MTILTPTLTLTDRNSQSRPWQRGEFVRLFAPAWALLEEGLAAALSDSLLRGYWADYMASEARGEPDAKHIQASRPVMSLK